MWPFTRRRKRNRGHLSIAPSSIDRRETPSDTSWALWGTSDADTGSSSHSGLFDGGHSGGGGGGADYGCDSGSGSDSGGGCDGGNGGGD